MPLSLISRYFLAVTTVLITSCILQTVQANDIVIVTLAYENEALDLDSGAIKTASIPDDLLDADIQIAFNADRISHAVLKIIPQSQTQLAYAYGIAFDGVTAESLSLFSFSTNAVDVPFDNNLTLVARTIEGNFFKLGNISVSESSITFNYSAL